MNGVALRAELALAEYLSAASWPDDAEILLEDGNLLLLESGSSVIYSRGLGAPDVLPSFARGEYEDEDEQDTMPAFPSRASSLRRRFNAPRHPRNRWAPRRSHPAAV